MENEREYIETEQAAEDSTKGKLESIPYIVHEYELAKANKRGLRLFIALAATASALIATSTVLLCLFKRK